MDRKHTRCFDQKVTSTLFLNEKILWKQKYVECYVHYNTEAMEIRKEVIRSCLSAWGAKLYSV